MKRQIIKWVTVLFVCVILPTLITSCGNDDEPNDTVKYDIEGYWIQYSGGYSVTFALEIKRSEKYTDPFIFRSWHYGTDHHLCMGWTSVLSSFSLYLNDYKCNEDSGGVPHKIISVSGVLGGRTMVLEDKYGTQYYFKEVSKQEFEDAIQESLDATPGSGGTTTDYARLVSQNSSAKGVISDYEFEVRITHTLKNKLPNTSLDYKIVHAYHRNATDGLTIDYPRNPVVKSVSTSGSETIVTFRYPMFYYFMVKYTEATTMTERDYYGEILVKCEMYLASYKALCEIERNEDLTSEERQLKKELVKYLDEYKSMVIGSYSVLTYIVIDDKSYLCSTLNF